MQQSLQNEPVLPKKRKIRLGALELAKFQKNMPVSHTAHGDRK